MAIAHSTGSEEDCGALLEGTGVEADDMRGVEAEAGAREAAAADALAISLLLSSLISS